MNAVERIEAAIKRLVQVKSSLGFVAVGEDPKDLYVRVEEDDDGEGVFTFGLSIGGGVDADEEINEAFALLSRTIDAQLAILRAVIESVPIWIENDGPMDEAELEEDMNFELALADAILGEVAS